MGDTINHGLTVWAVWTMNYALYTKQSLKIICHAKGPEVIKSKRKYFYYCTKFHLSTTNPNKWRRPYPKLIFRSMDKQSGVAVDFMAYHNILYSLWTILKVWIFLIICMENKFMMALSWIWILSRDSNQQQCRNAFFINFDMIALHVVKKDIEI